MKYTFALVIGLFVSCTGSQRSTITPSSNHEKGEKIQNSEIQSILGSLDVVGSVLVYDLQKDIYQSNNFDWATKGHLPASTFKIANSIIGLETGVLDIDSTVFEWDGTDRWSSSWEKDLTVRDAFRLSCVPCYQEVAREIGVDRMNENINKLNYGHITVDERNLDDFWLVGTARISQMEQIDFLKKLFSSRLPIATKTEKIIKDIMIIDKNDIYTLSGKTGLSNENDHYNGWFVGYLETEERTLFFASNIEPIDQQKRNGFSKKRRESTLKTLSLMLPFEL